MPLIERSHFLESNFTNGCDRNEIERKDGLFGKDLLNTIVAQPLERIQACATRQRIFVNACFKVLRRKRNIERYSMKKLARGKNKYSIRHLGKVVDSCVNSTGATIPLFFSLFFFPIVKSTLRTVDETKNDSDNPFDGLDNAYDNVALPRAFFFSFFLFFFHSPTRA